MSQDPISLVEILRSHPWLAFDRVLRVRAMPAIQRPSIASFRTQLTHVGRDGVRRAVQPDLTFVADVDSPTEPLRKWALLVDVLPKGRFDAERAWSWPFVHATLRHELGVPTLHLVFVEPERFAEISEAYGWEPELMPILVGSLDADADAVARRLARASGYD
jgi:hypothetical protein